MKKGTKFFLITFLTIIVIGLLLLIISLVGLPSLKTLETYQPSLSSKIYSSDNTIFAEFGPERRTLVNLDQIPDNMKNAAVAIEDERFFKHKGIDFRGITRAAMRNILHIKLFKEGASTITQQLARSMFLTRQKNLVRKLKEALLALEIEKKYPKEKILEMFLNQIYFGSGAYGVSAASQTFFAKNIQELNLAECALLAAIQRNPTYYSPYKNPERAYQRQKIVLSKMKECGFINEEEEKTARNTKIILRNPTIKSVKAAYFVEYLRIYLGEKYGEDVIYKGGFEVYTTLDLNIQRAAEDIFQSHVQQLRKNLNKTDLNGSLIAIDPRTGEIKALVGGYNFAESQFNRATQANRQPGSAFKPFVYLAAMDRGFKPDDTILDTEVSYPSKTTGKWTPHNYEGKYYGEVTLRNAIAYSINVATIKLLEEIGPENVIPYARACGITSFLGADLSLALGTYVVTPIELTQAYCTIQNKGIRTEPFAIRIVKDNEGRILEQNSAKQETVLNPHSCEATIDLMRSVIEYGTGRWAKDYGFTYPCAGKTGTTDDYSDAWFVGMTPQLVSSVYIGCDKRKSLGQKMSGSSVALPIWAEFMARAYPYALQNSITLPIGNEQEPDASTN